MTLEATRRREAPPVRRAAADWIDDVRASMLCTFPPHPPITKAPPYQGKPHQGRGWSDRFSRWIDSGSRVEGSFPWIAIIFFCDFLDLARASARLTIFRFPRIASFFPRVGSFYPRVCFSRSRLFFLLSPFFKRERERERRGNAKSDDPRIQFVTRGYKTYGSWKKQPFHGFSGDAFLSNLQCWRGFTCGRAPIHGFWWRNAPPSLAGAVCGGGHGGR